MSCSGEGCNSIYIQNKKYNLCSDCVFKKSHGGKSKQEVYAERSKSRDRVQRDVKLYKDLIAKHPPINFIEEANKIMFGKHYHVDEISAINARNQELALEKEKQDQQDIDHIEKVIQKQKRQKSVRKISSKQKEINKAYSLTCADMDYTTEPVCTGCLQYQGGDIKLSHSHIISREDCKRIGREDLISDRENLTYHCLDFGEHEGCHRKWENPTQRHLLADIKKNMKYIKSINNELYLKYFSIILNK